MGTDIHMYAERRHPDGSWALEGGMEPNSSLCLGGDERYTDDDNKLWPPLIPVTIFDVRNHELFAILANVTNGMGTADERRYEYISPPRGLPADLSPELREFADAWGDDFKFPTWLLLEEVFSFPWKEKGMLRKAMVDARAAPLFAHESPRLPGQAPQPRVGFPFAEWPEGVPISYGVYLRDGVTVQWMETYEAVSDDFFDLLASLRALGDPANTRLVFWFDD